MAHQKIEQNIYYDERCSKMPFYVSIMRRGHSFYKKFNTLEEAQEAKTTFINRHETQETEHPSVFIRGDKYVIEIMIEKSFDDYEEAVKKANLLQRFVDN